MDRALFWCIYVCVCVCVCAYVCVYIFIYYMPVCHSISLIWFLLLPGSQGYSDWSFSSRKSSGIQKVSAVCWMWFSTASLFIYFLIVPLYSSSPTLWFLKKEAKKEKEKDYFIFLSSSFIIWSCVWFLFQSTKRLYFPEFRHHLQYWVKWSHHPLQVSKLCKEGAQTSQHFRREHKHVRSVGEGTNKSAL